MKQVSVPFFCIAIFVLIATSIGLVASTIVDVSVQRFDLQPLSKLQTDDLLDSLSGTQQQAFHEFFQEHDSINTINSTYVLSKQKTSALSDGGMIASLNYANLDFGRFTLLSKSVSDYSNVFGDEVSFSTREKFFRLPIYDIPLDSQADKLLVQVVDTISSELQISIYDDRSFDKYSQYDFFLYGLYFGLLLLLVAGSLFLLFFTGELSFLWYSIYLSCSVVFLLSACGLGQAVLWDEQAFTTRYSYWATAGMALSITLFAQSFIVNVSKSWWFQWLSRMNLAALAFICVCLFFFHHGTVDTYFFLFAFLQMAAVFGFAVQAYLQRQRDALFLIFGYLALFPSLILSILKFSGFLESNPITNHSVEASLLVEAVIFSSGLGFKLRRLARAEKEVVRTRENFLNKLITVREDEKRDLAVYLHNSVAQILALLKSKLFRLETSATPKLVSEVHGLADQAMLKVRSISHDTYPHALKEIGLASAIEHYAEKHLEQVDVDFKCSISYKDNDDRKTLLLYRILQECINNVVRHANASRLNLKLECQGIRCRLEFSDDGDGFDTRVSGFGLETIREYTQALNGQFQVQSTVNAGTTITIEF